MNDIAPIPNLAKDRTFAWRMQTGEKKLVKDMDTSHLYNTVCMIWNHTMGDVYVTDPNYKRYTFSAYYTRPYMIAAISCMVPTLIYERYEELNGVQKQTIMNMAKTFRRNDELTQHLERLTHERT